MAKRKLRTEFEPGRGYTKEDWDGVDSPELTDEELAHMRPAQEALPPEFFKALETARRSRGRPTLENPKKQVTLRLDSEVRNASAQKDPVGRAGSTTF
jgi:uncharacterized protein (DUF4415 family)